MALSIRPLHPMAEDCFVRTYYFDMQDGVPIRDIAGLQFRTNTGAIEQAKSWLVDLVMTIVARIPSAQSSSLTSPARKFIESRCTKTSVSLKLPSHLERSGEAKYWRRGHLTKTAKLPAYGETKTRSFTVTRIMKSPWGDDLGSSAWKTKKLRSE